MIVESIMMTEKGQEQRNVAICAIYVILTLLICSVSIRDVYFNGHQRFLHSMFSDTKTVIYSKKIIPENNDFSEKDVVRISRNNKLIQPERVDDILLMIKLNYAERAVYIVQTHYAIWSRYFVHIVYYAPFSPGQVALLEEEYNVEVCDDDAGEYSPYIIVGSLYMKRKYQKFKGYVCMHDDIIINPKLFQKDVSPLDFNKIWLPDLTMEKSEQWGHWDNGGLNSTKALMDDHRFRSFNFAKKIKIVCEKRFYWPHG
eukprot:UN23829